MYELQVLVNGHPIKKYFKDNKAYVIAKKRSSYTIEFKNKSSYKVLANITVDGRSVIDGKLGDLDDHKGYIVEPFGTLVVDGWRESLDRVGQFVFERKNKAYSSRLDTPEECGVIACAVYKEKESHRLDHYINIEPMPYKNWPSTTWYCNDSHTGTLNPSSVTVSDVGSFYNCCGGTSCHCKEVSDTPIQQAGTGYGQSVQSEVTTTSFHAEQKPDEILTIYYDFYEELKRRKVILNPKKEVYMPTGFPMSFCKPPKHRI